MKNLKEYLKKNYFLYRNLRNFYAVYKGINGLIRGKRGSLEYLKSSISLTLKQNKILGKPINITIEPTNVCNAQCPICETGASILKRRKKFLSFQDFKIIIDKIYKHTNTLMYYFMGEPFLNKEWVKQIKYAKSKGIPFITTCTNGDVDGIPEGIIESGIDFVSFQIGGMTQKTHEIYRVNTDLGNIKRNILRTLELKRKYNSKVHIEVGFIVMKHNEHEINAFIDWCKTIGVDSYNIIAPCVRNIEQGRVFLPNNRSYWIYDYDSFEQGKLCRINSPKNDCPWIYYSFVVLVNGDVIPCCHDPQGNYVMGNLIRENLEDIWNNPKFVEFRKKIHTNQKNIEMCRLCSGYGISDLK